MQQLQQQHRTFRQEDFEPVRVIGKGSTGKVMLVLDKLTGAYYALKSIRKRELPTDKQRRLARQERDLLIEAISKVRSAFLVRLHACFQSPTHLFFLLDYHPGGDFASLLSQMHRVAEPVARFYVAELILGLEALHRAKIVYRDLKPENILLGRDGHAVLTDFGLSKALGGINGTTRTFCGTAEYLAPEVLLGQPYDYGVDLWSLGTILFEILTGTPPYWAETSQTMYSRIIEGGPIEFPDFLGKDAKDVVRQLLRKDPTSRLGYGSMAPLKSHPFFKDLDWTRLEAKTLPPPLRLNLESDRDVRAFDPAFTNMVSAFTPAAGGDAAGEEGSRSYHFQGFTFSGDSSPN